MSSQLENYDFFKKELPKLLADHRKGQFVIIKDETIVKFFNNLGDALDYRYQNYGIEHSDCIIQEVIDGSKRVQILSPDYVKV